MFEIIRADIARSNKVRFAVKIGPLEIGQAHMFAFGLQTIIVYRYGQWVKSRFVHPVCLPLKWSLMFVYKLLTSVVRKLYDINLHSSAKIGPGLKIGHFGGIEVGSCSLGSNCSIQQHVKIGKNNQLGEKGPKIGSYVWIGSHSTILCDITIADHATIGAGSIVEHDVAGKSLILGSPARIINKNYDNSEILDARF